jgi:hypothetical protein
LVLTANRAAIAADGRDLSYVEVHVVDAQRVSALLLGPRKSSEKLRSGSRPDTRAMPRSLGNRLEDNGS